MTPLQGWLIYAAIVIFVLLPFGFIMACCCVAGRYDRESDRLFEECKRHPELKDGDA